MVNVANDVPREDGTVVTMKFEGNRGFSVLGHDSRLGQVINNLIDNARSFSPQGGTVRVTCKRYRGDIDIVVDDDGPGIHPEATEKIFDRFYTYRPHEDFGQNSGLGLSISKQIVEAHDGRLWAENRIGATRIANVEAGDYWLERRSVALICCGASPRPISGGLVAARLEIRQVFLRCSLLTRQTSARALAPRDAQCN